MRTILSTVITGGFLMLTGLMAKADTRPSPVSAGNAYGQHNLVSDGFVQADHTDPNLVNPWGIAFNPVGPAWVADNGTGVATVYDGSGNAQPNPRHPLVVTIPPPEDGAPPSAPNGIVFNFTRDFVVSKGGKSSVSLFIFSTEDGTISGWDPGVDPTHAILAVDNSEENTVYKGLALAGNGAEFRLYASDFRHNKVDVFDSRFRPVTTPGGFVDADLPAGFAPFGIQTILGNIYVTYAKQNAARHDDVAGPGNGFIDVFDPDGNLIRRVASRGALNSPWGLAVAPANFGKFSNRLLVGNFGDGRINAFDLATGDFKGFLRRPGRAHEALVIDGLWGIVFGNGILNQPSNILFFAAGVGGEAHGLYGRIEAQPGGIDD